MAPGRYQETSHLKKKDGKDPLRTAAQYDANRRLPQLCGKLEKNKPIPADPSTFRQVLRSLRPGETMLLAPGDYPPLKIVGLRGGRERCIAIAGPSQGPAAVIRGVPGSNTVDIVDASFLAIKNLVIDSRGIPGAFGISAGRGTSSLTHHILIEGNTLIGQGGAQQTDGISTKTPTWGWVIRRNKILGAGTGIYLGNSDGSSPFFAGIIEGNLIQDPIGYCLQVKYQLGRSMVRGMPTGQNVTIIRDNVFIKNDHPSPDGDRPNLLVGGFPDSGAGSNDMYEIYGNFFYHNPREALFQGSGRISFHDNILVGGEYAAAVFRNHDLPLKLAHIYNNTIYTKQEGIKVVDPIPADVAVVGNLVFAATPIAGNIRRQQGNVADTVANAAHYVNAPSFSLASIDFYPRPRRAEGSPLDCSTFAKDVDSNLDFNRRSKGDCVFRGAYAGSGTNPGWRLKADMKPLP